MTKIDVSGWSSFEQSVLDILIKGFVFVVLLLINFIVASLTNGTIQLPYPAVTLPLATIILSQLDSYFVAWAKKENVPVPTSTNTTTQ